MAMNMTMAIITGYANRIAFGTLDESDFTDIQKLIVDIINAYNDKELTYIEYKLSVNYAIYVQDKMRKCLRTQGYLY
jgi:hypothetical protein